MFRKIGDWFRKLGDRFRSFMTGRYGSDRLNLVLLIAAMVLSLACSFTSSIAYLSVFLSVLSYALLFFAVFRAFSRNIVARQKEASAFNNFIRLFTDRSCRYFSCPSCGQNVRVPRHKGKISIHCPRCGQRFQKKT